MNIFYYVCQNFVGNNLNSLRKSDLKKILLEGSKTVRFFGGLRPKPSRHLLV